MWALEIIIRPLARSKGTQLASKCWPLMWLDRDTRRKSFSTVGVHVSYDMLTVCVMLIDVLCTSVSVCDSSRTLHGVGLSDNYFPDSRSRYGESLIVNGWQTSQWLLLSVPPHPMQSPWRTTNDVILMQQSSIPHTYMYV